MPLRRPGFSSSGEAPSTLRTVTPLTVEERGDLESLNPESRPKVPPHPQVVSASPQDKKAVNEGSRKLQCKELAFVTSKSSSELLLLLRDAENDGALKPFARGACEASFRLHSCNTERKPRRCPVPKPWSQAC